MWNVRVIHNSKQNTSICIFSHFMSRMHQSHLIDQFVPSPFLSNKQRSLLIAFFSVASFFSHFPPLTMKKYTMLFENVVFTAFHNVLVHVCILITVLLIKNGNDSSLALPSTDVLKDVICDLIEQYDVGYICPQQNNTQEQNG